MRPTRMDLRIGRRSLLGAAAVGALAGFLSGLFGVGGGILIVPGLVFIMRMGQRLAHGTSLAAIVPIALSGVGGYAANHSVDWAVGGYLILGSIVGAFAGTRALRSMPQRALRLAFATFLLLTAVRLLVVVHHAAGRGPINAGLALGLVGLGILAGVVAGLLGVGGGTVMIPALVILFSMPDALAKGTSLLVIIPAAIAGTIGNLRHGNADLRVAAPVGLFGVASAFGGSHLAVHMSDRLSSVLFGILLLAVSARMFLTREERTPSGRPEEAAA